MPERHGTTSIVYYSLADATKKAVPVDILPESILRNLFNRPSQEEMQIY
jgi:hypothetical protein